MTTPLDVMRTIVGTQWSSGAPSPTILAWEEFIAATYPDMAAYIRAEERTYLAWCGLTVAYCCAKAGIRPVNEFLWALNWRSFGTDASSNPQPGDVAVFEWAGGGHHVTLIDHGNTYLGGNQSHEVRDSTFSAQPIAVRRPLAVQAQPPPTQPQPRQTGITATVFGGAGDYNTSAYDGHVITDQELGVALPYHFSGARPKVRVYANGRSVDCAICDVGPWNVNNPYWQTGVRPEAESGTDNTGRHTNHAGIDLTPAAAAALGISGKGTVDWEFIDMTDTTTTAPAPAIPPLKNGIDPSALFNGIKQGLDEAVMTLAMLNTAWQAFQAGKPIPGVPTLPAPAPAPAPVVLPAPAPAPAPSSAKQPSVWLSLALFGGATLLQLLGMVGAPVAIPGLIPTTAVTANGALASLVPLISAAFGKGGGWSIVGKVLGAIGPALGQALANSNAAQPPAAK